MDKVEKQGGVRQATYGNTAHSLYMPTTKAKYRHTLKLFNTHCFSTATTVTRTRLNVALYTH